MSEKIEIKEKPGYKTSEFWLTLVVVLLGTLMASGVFGDESVIMKAAGMAMATLKALGYTAARAKTKLASSMERASLGKPSE